MKQLYLTISLSLIFSITNFYKSQSEIWGVNASGVNGLGSIYTLPTGNTALAAQYSFTGNPGSGPQYTKLLEVPGGKLYGMTNAGGINNLGVIFEYDTAANTYVKKFDFSTLMGANPKGSLMMAGNGKLYGMTQFGGASNQGVIFEYDLTTGTYTKKVDFTGATGLAVGAQPFGTLIESAPNSGKLYGMTQLGGSGAAGVIFEYDYLSNIYTKKVDFTGNAGAAPGGNPYGQLTKAGSNFYGLTNIGGANNAGVLFEYDYTNNVYTKKVDLIAATGSRPQSSLLLVGSVLYGTHVVGGAGAPAGGVIFKYDYGTNTYTKLTDLVQVSNGGSSPACDLIQAANGKLYGMTRIGGVYSGGVIFEYDITGPTYTKKYDLGITTATGSVPIGSLIQASTGKLYGMTSAGGTYSVGVIFQYNISTNAYVKKIDLNFSNGGNPNGGLIQAGNGKLYGMAASGGTAVASTGVIYEYDKTTQTYTKKVDLNATTGNTPYGSLIEASNGRLYGLTSGGGANSLGTLIEYDYSGNTFTKKVDFNGSAGTSLGGAPYGSLVQFSGNSKLYGMTKQGGTAGLGTIFEYDYSANTITKKQDLTAANGYSAYGSMVESSGKLYGMTSLGGANSLGVIFEYDPATNTYTNKIDLTGISGLAPGSMPFGSMVQSPTVGILYGMTRNGGANDLGVIFEYNVSTNTYTNKYSMTASGGSQPWGSPIKAANGKLYGVTNMGGANSSGALFEYDIAASTYTKKIDFSSSTGNFPTYTQLLEICTKPLTPGAISSSTNTLCQGDATLKTFSISPVSNATSYSWTLPSGASITSGSTISTINSNLSGVVAGTYSFGVSAVNVCGTGTLSISNLTVNAVPSISVNSGQICAGSSFTIIPTGASTYSVQGNLFVVSPSGDATYTVVGVSSAGCISSNIPVASVTVHALPIIGVNNGTVCAGTPFTITPTGVVSSTVSGGSFVVSPLTSTSYTLIGTDANNCVSANTATSNLTVNAVPVISISNASICAGQTATLTPSGAGAGGTYTLDGTSGSGPFLLVPGSTTSYTVTGTSSLNCVSSNTANFSVTVYSLPIIAAANATMCATKGATITPTGAGAGATYTFNSVSGSGPFSVNPSGTTNYTVAGASSFGCLSSNVATLTVTVYTLPVISVNNGTVCAGVTHTFFPGGAVSYTMTGPVSGTAFPVQPPASASYTIAGTSTDGCISASPVTANLVVNALPTLSVNSGTTCAGSAFTITPLGGSVYTIQPSGTVITTSLVVSPASTSTYSIIGANTAGCLSSGIPVSTVTAVALPVITASSGAVCIGSVFTASVSGANSSYTFVSSSQSFTSGAVTSATLNPSVTTTYSVSGKNNSGCVSSSAAVMVVTVNALPLVNITGANAICEGETTTLTANGADSYNWGSSTNTILSVNPVTSTVYTLTGTDLNTCTNTATFTLTVNQIPTITVISGAICPGNSFTLTPGGASTYSYSSGSNIVTPVTTTSYSVIGTSSAGCVATSSAVATVSVVNILTVTISGNTTICKGGTVNLTANGASTYLWSTTDVTNTVTLSPVSSTTYTVIGSSGTCSDVATVAVTVNNLPSVSAVADRTLICVGESVSVTSGGAVTYSWNTSATGTLITGSPQTSTLYIVTGIDANNCVNTATAAVLVSPCTGIENYSGNAWAYGIYPNPNAGEFVVETSVGVTATIINALGQTVLSKQLNEGKNQIDLNNEAKGIYFVQLKNGSTSKIIKIVKQ